MSNENNSLPYAGSKAQPHASVTKFRSYEFRAELKNQIAQQVDLAARKHPVIHEMIRTADARQQLITELGRAVYRALDATETVQEQGAAARDEFGF